MEKRPSEMNVVDRIFYDIKVHGIDSVLKKKDFYQNYEPSNLNKDAVSSSICFNECSDTQVSPNEKICLNCGSGIKQTDC